MTIANRLRDRTQLAVLEPNDAGLSSTITVDLPAYDHIRCSSRWVIASLARGRMFHYFDEGGNLTAAISEHPLQSSAAVGGSVPPGLLYSGRFAMGRDGKLFFMYANFPVLQRLNCEAEDLGQCDIADPGAGVNALEFISERWPQFAAAGASGSVVALNNAVAAGSSIAVLHGAFGSSCRVTFWSEHGRYLQGIGLPERSFALWWIGEQLVVASIPSHGEIDVEVVP